MDIDRTGFLGREKFVEEHKTIYSFVLSNKVGDIKIQLPFAHNSYTVQLWIRFDGIVRNCSRDRSACHTPGFRRLIVDLGEFVLMIGSRIVVTTGVIVVR